MAELAKVLEAEGDISFQRKPQETTEQEGFVLEREVHDINEVNEINDFGDAFYTNRKGRKRTALQRQIKKMKIAEKSSTSPTLES